MVRLPIAGAYKKTYKKNDARASGGESRPQPGRFKMIVKSVIDGNFTSVTPVCLCQ